MWDNNPSWLNRLERRFKWIAIPNIAVIFITLQAFGSLMVMSDPIWAFRLALVPEAVRAGEYWRLVTFLALPLSTGPIWILFTLWFIYFVLNSIESHWGDFKTTLYTLVSILVTIAFSFATDYPITSVRHFESSLFFAAAALFPDMEINLYMIIPVKIKWLAAFTGALVVISFISGSWHDRFFLLSIYSNFLVFFGPAVLGRLKQYYRKKKYLKKLRD